MKEWESLTEMLIERERPGGRGFIDGGWDTRKCICTGIVELSVNNLIFYFKRQSSRNNCFSAKLVSYAHQCSQ